MKALVIALLTIMVGFSVVAAEDQTPNKPFLVNGKKFYPIRNARTFHGNQKPMSMLLPRKQTPRTGLPTAHSSGTAPAPVVIRPGVNNVTNPAAANTEIPNNSPPNQKSAAEVLSVFSPQEK